MKTKLKTMRTQNAISAIYRDLFCLIVLLALFYNIGLGYYPLFTPDEGRYSEVAREMLVTHDYVTPRVNGIAFLDKPVLYYWLQALSMRVFGLSEWALRFFPMLAGLCLTLATYFFAHQLFDRRAALLSAGILATSPLVFAAAHYANLDLEVALFITLSLYAGMIALYRPAFFNVGLYLSVVAASLAVLTKGLIGLFFPGLILGVMFLYLRRFQYLTVTNVLISILLFSLIVLPWFIAVQIKNPQFFHYFFIVQQVNRFLSQATFNNPTPSWFYLPVVLIGFFPWSLFLYPAVKHAILQIKTNAKERAIGLFLLLYSLAVLVFFSLPQSKIVTYILPIFPPLALLVGWYLSANWVTIMERRYALYGMMGVAFSTVLVLVSLPFIAPRFNTQSTKAFASVIKPLMTHDTEVVSYFDYFHDLPLYLEKTVKVVGDWQDPMLMRRDNWRREFALGAAFQDVSTILLDEKTFWQHWQHKHLLVIMSKSDFEQLRKTAKDYRILKETRNIVLVSNQIH